MSGHGELEPCFVYGTFHGLRLAGLGGRRDGRADDFEGIPMQRVGRLVRKSKRHSKIQDVA